MYLYVIKRDAKREIRHYEELKNGREKHVYTMSSEAESSRIVGVYAWCRYAKSDLEIIKGRDRQFNETEHIYLNDTTAGRKIYSDLVIQYSIKGHQFNTVYASVRNGEILETASQERSLKIPAGLGIKHMELVKIDGKFYEVHKEPVYTQHSESADENQ